MECSRDGIFACGNVVHIHDLVDFVSEEAMLAGKWAGQYAAGHCPAPDNILLRPGENVAYCVPQTICSERDHTVYLRVREPREQCTLQLTADGSCIYAKKLRYVVPAEMVNLKLRSAILEKCHGTTLGVEVVKR
jgi:hypothetical protein